MPKINADHIDKTRPTLMVLGTPRSGTTLLTALLGSHPGIAMLDEDKNGGVLAITGNKLPGVKLCVPAQIHPTKRKNWVTDLIELNGGLRNRFGQWRTHSTLSMADYEGARDMRYLCLIRQPGATLASIMARAGKRAHIAEQTILRGYQMMAEVAADPNRQSLVIDYDTLVANTEETLRQICDWLGRPFDPAMLEGAAHNHRYPNAQIHKGRDAGAGAPKALQDAYAALQPYCQPH